MAGTVFYNADKADLAIKNRDELMAHVEASITNGFYIEATVILHSMIENYTYKLLHILNIPYKASDRLFQCMAYLKKHIDENDIHADLEHISNEAVAAYFSKHLFASGLAGAISTWRKERNLIIHDVAIEELSKERFLLLAAEGKRLFEVYEEILKGFVS
ncbi:MAG: hypothetical protein IJF15_07205 [Oscillospiraceae bacterium]|nr:hypothetical protein [Oscillospiraceae bacterium]